jgi:hypothetical protein
MLLDHRFSDFRPGANQTMVMLGAMLTGWLRTEVDRIAGYGGSILSSTNEERFDLAVKPFATTEEIANSIVSQGSKGMWTFRASTPSPVNSAEVEIEPYQRYTNIAVDR